MELIIAVVLIAIVSGVMALMMPLRGHKLSAAGQKMAADIRFAQQLAVSKQVPAGVLFNASSDAYSVFVNTTNNTTVDPFTGAAFAINFAVEPALKGVDIYSTSFGTNITFDYMGAPMNLTQNATITLRQGGNSCQVIVAPRTGQVKVQ